MTDDARIQQLLREQNYMVLAVTLADGTPWAVPVRFNTNDGWSVFDWDSHLETEHSRALVLHPDSAITIFWKQDASQTGFYAKGKAELVAESKPGFGHYRFTAKQAWINDETFKKREVKLQ